MLLLSGKIVFSHFFAFKYQAMTTFPGRLGATPYVSVVAIKPSISVVLSVFLTASKLGSKIETEYFEILSAVQVGT